MKRLALIIIFMLLLWFRAFAQNKDVWIAFWNEDRTMIGFKDRAGQIKIVPKFNVFTIAGKFDKIIGVSEEKGEIINSYYLTKKGRIVGEDNLYIFDNGADCESEGFIRFRDKITHKVGMFNSNGDIAIPADYDDLMPVRNGMIMALKDGHWDASQQSEHNQFPWVGGKEVLISTHNKELINNFPYSENINFFSLIISKEPNRTPVRQNFKASDGKCYSFINFDKEFKVWLKDSLLKKLTRSNLLRISYKKITFWNKPKGWVNEAKEPFIDKNFKLIKSKLLELDSANCDYNIFTDGLNPYIYNSKDFVKYFDNCGASKDWIYPIKTIVITHKINKDILQDQLGFLRTDKGYKLIEISINLGEIQ
jgi:hypothetical protein